MSRSSLQLQLQNYKKILFRKSYSLAEILERGMQSRWSEDGSGSDFGNNVMIVKFDVCTGAGNLHPNPPCLLPSSSAFAIALNSERH